MKKVFAIFIVFCLLCLTGCSLTSGEGNYKFSEDTYPKIGGSSTAEILGKAIAATTLSKNINEVDSFVEFSDTTAEAYEALCNGDVDIIIAYEPNAAILSQIKKSGKSVEYTPIAADALLLICSNENEVDSLTENEISGIFSGRIKTWNEVGGEETEILPYQSEENSSERELFDRTLNLGDRLKKATKDVILTSYGELLTATATYDNSKQAIGYTSYHNVQLVTDGLSNNIATVKILSVDDVSPSYETIFSEEYALTQKLYVAVRKSSLSTSPERVLFNWICSEQGKELITNQKFVAVEN